MSSGRLFQSFGPPEANERSPTVTRRDGRTSSWLEIADRRRRRDRKSDETANTTHINSHFKTDVFVWYM